MEVMEAMRCVLLCILEAVESGLCLLEVLEVPEVMCFVSLCMLEVVEGARGSGGDVLYATLFAGGARGDTLCGRYYSVCWRL